MTIMGGPNNKSNKGLPAVISEITVEISKLIENTKNWTSEKVACNKIDVIASGLKSILKANNDLTALAPAVAADLAKCKGATPVRNAKKLGKKLEKLQTYTGALIRVFVNHAQTVQCGTRLNGPAKALQNLTQAALDAHTAFLSSK